MSKRKELRDIKEEKRLLVAKAELQRSTFLMLANPIFKVVRAAEFGVIAMRTGKAVVRYIKH
ncbi:MAG: hypothetical protein ACLFP4_06165 [Spirochaetales bacterium]